MANTHSRLSLRTRLCYSRLSQNLMSGQLIKMITTVDLVRTRLCQVSWSRWPPCLLSFFFLTDKKSVFFLSGSGGFNPPLLVVRPLKKKKKCVPPYTLEALFSLYFYFCNTNYNCFYYRTGSIFLCLLSLTSPKCCLSDKITQCTLLHSIIFIQSTEKYS